MTFHDPVGQYPSRPTCGLDSDRVETGRHKEPIHLGRLPQVVGSVRGKRLRPVQEQLDTAFAQRRHPMDGTLQNRADVFPVLRQGTEGEITGHLVLPGLGLRLKEPGHDLAGLFLEVGVVGRISQGGQIGRYPLQRLGHHIEVLAGQGGDVHPGGGGQLTGPHSSGDHHRFRLDISGFGLHPHRPFVLHPNRGDRHPFHQSGPPILGTFRQRHGGVDRTGLPVLGEVDCPDQVVNIHQRPLLGGLIRFEDLNFDSGGPGHRHPPQNLLPSFGIRRHRDRSGGAVAGSLVGFVLQLLEEAGGVGGQFGEGVVRLELADQSGGVPGGSAGQGVLLQQQDIGYAPSGEVIGDRTAHDAAADHHHLRPIGKLLGG